MKYLKMFESKSETQSYKEIYLDEYTRGLLLDKNKSWSVSNNNKSILFNDDEISLLRKEFSNNNITNNITNYSNDENNPNIKGHILIREPLRKSGSAFAPRLAVRKLPDEWYYILYDKRPNTSYYKCDQWHGLIDCLNFLLQNTSERLKIDEDVNLSFYTSIPNIEYDENEYDTIFFEKEEIMFMSKFTFIKIEESFIKGNNKSHKPIFYAYKKSDEWYYLSIRNEEEKSWWNYYKCDQWEAVVKFFEDKKDYFIRECGVIRMMVKDKKNLIIKDELPPEERANENKNSAYYTEIEDEEYDENEQNTIEFDKTEIIYYNKYLRVFIDKSPNRQYVYGMDDKNRVIFYTYKLIDEWYYIALFQNNNIHNANLNDKYWKFYKCDQWEAVKQLLEDKKKFL